MGLIFPYKGKLPSIASDAFIAPNATVIGDVEIGARSSVWFGVVLRGDANRIRIGAGSNIQDNSVVHVGNPPSDTIIGDNVLIGHMAMIHGCHIESGSFIGMQSTILDGAVIESGALVAAGSLVGPGKRVTSGQLWAGRPARPVRALSDREQDMVRNGPGRYAEYAQIFREEMMSSTEV